MRYLDVQAVLRDDAFFRYDGDTAGLGGCLNAEDLHDGNLQKKPGYVKAKQQKT